MKQDLSKEKKYFIDLCIKDLKKMTQKNLIYFNHYNSILNWWESLVRKT